MKNKESYDNSALHLMYLLCFCFFIFILMLSAVAYSDYKEAKQIESLSPEAYNSYLLEQEEIKTEQKEKEEKRKKEEERFTQEMASFSQKGITLMHTNGLNSAEFLIENIGIEKKLILGKELPVGKSIDVYTESQGEIHTKWHDERTGSYLFGTVWQHNNSFSIPDLKEGDSILLKYQDAVTIIVYFN